MLRVYNLTVNKVTQKEVIDLPANILYGLTTCLIQDFRLLLVVCQKKEFSFIFHFFLQTEYIC